MIKDEEDTGDHSKISRFDFVRSIRYAADRSFVSVAGAPVPPSWPQRVGEMKEMIATVPETGTNTVLITHFPNIKAALGI